MLMLVILIAAQVDFVVGSFLGPINDEEKSKGFVGYNCKYKILNIYYAYIAFGLCGSCFCI